MPNQLPTFAEMNGYAVSTMNELARGKRDLPANVPVLFPVEMRTIHGRQVFLVNETSGVFWYQGLPPELCSDEWACILIQVERNPEKLALQQLLFPGLGPFVCAVEAQADWRAAVEHAVLHAASLAWAKHLVADIPEN